MMIRFWDCDFGDCDSHYNDDGEEVFVYICAHKSGCGICPLDNKICGDEVECALLINHEEKES